MLGNVEAAITGTRRALRHRRATRYLAGFEWHGNRRTNLAEILPRLAHAALLQHPTPYRFFSPAEAAV